MRPERLNPLFAEVESLAGVGPALVRALARLDIVRVRDLLFHLPVGWRRTHWLDRLVDGREGERVALRVVITGREAARGRGPVRVMADDAGGLGLSLAFFGRAGEGLSRRFKLGESYVIAGKLELWQARFQMAHPEIVTEAVEAEPVYPLTEGLTSRRMAALVEGALQRLPVMGEWIEPSMLAKQRWPDFGAAMRAAHQEPGAGMARDRLAYDEMLSGQLAWALVRARRRRARSRVLAGDGRLVDAFIAALPFSLTGAQRRAILDVTGDVAQSAAMLRLLQGDVGSGKTVVAAASLLMAVEAGAQGALLAPTDLLARQHFATMQAMLAGLPVRLAFLSGRDKGKAREATLMALAAGTIDIIIGTHAIFQAGVEYRDLGLAVVDEQHRFGVAQRLMLAEKGQRAPHLLVMTATPIPRTLALANFGEMDVSRLDERPPGRQPVDTRVISLQRLEDVLDALARHLAGGAQAYWVCPLVDGGGDGEVREEPGAAATAVTRAAMLKARFGDTVALVHGRLGGDVRDAAMGRFHRGEVKLLVATTVIEVGVDVPNASLMIIEGAEEFGLAQLHQLRGRVGRGTAKSSCILLRGDMVSETARARLKMMRETEDGFAIAEADLKLRGIGELLGTRQSGEQGFAIATPEQMERLLPAAQADARLLIERDGGLEGPRGAAARDLLYLFDRDSAVGLLKSG